ncbi:MAG: GAF domain-containing protein [Anaerolineae bacterium]|nr:GAF domain-containing protein [Anaerolineae bacterium]
MDAPTDPGRSTQEINILFDVANLLTSLDLDDVLGKTLELLREAVGAERGSFFVFQENSDNAQRYITRRDLPPEHSQFVIQKVLDMGLAGWVFRHKEGAIVPNTLEDDRWVVLPDDLSPVRSVLCVPFVFSGHVNGIMTLEHKEPAHFSEGDLRLATAVANQAAIAIHNAQLFDQVETQERQLAAVVHSIADPLLTINPQGNVRLVNAALLDLVGPEEAHHVLGCTLGDNCGVPLLRHVGQRLQEGKVQFELRDEENKRDYAVQVSSWDEGKDQEFGHVIVFNDITALKDMARMKSQMIQMASHDLKGPIGVILGYTELMLSTTPKDARQYDWLTDVSHVTQRMLAMVKDLLDLERIESDPTLLHKPFQPADLLDGVLKGSAIKAAQKQQTLLREYSPDLPTLLGDTVQLHEALANFVDNAIKYTPDGGTVIVRAGVDKKANRFTFEVEDNGCGIPQELQHRIFQRFYRAKTPGTEHIPGTGLGLSLVKAVIEQHKGEVWFRSVQGTGSTFGLWLPVPSEEEVQAQRESSTTEDIP